MKSFFPTASHITRFLLGIGVAAVLFFTTLTPAHAQMTNEQRIQVMEILQQIINIQRQAIATGDPDLINQSNQLLVQASGVIEAVRASAPATNTDRDTDTPRTTSRNSDSEDEWAGDIYTDVCPDTSLTRQQLYLYADEGANSRGQQGGHFGGHITSNISPTFACLSEAIAWGCHNTKADHASGYTIHVQHVADQRSSGHFQNNDCFVGISPTNEPEEAVMCDVLEMVDRGRDASPISSHGGMYNIARTIMPEFLADHAFPLDPDDTSGSFGRNRENQSFMFGYFGNDPLQRLAFQSACSKRPIE